jgi:hypothetical protein
MRRPSDISDRPITARRAALRFVTAALCLQSAAPLGAAEARVEMLGRLSFPDQAAGTEAKPLVITGLSGVAWLGDTAWAAAMDNSDRLVTFTLELSAKGAPTAVTDVQTVRLEARHDYEDLAVCPPELARRITRRFTTKGRPDPGPCLLLCEEDTPAIRGAALADGRLVGLMPIPDVLKSRRPNRGLEALTVEPDGSCIWTANEEALTLDGPAPSATTGTVVRLVAIPIPTAAGTAATGTAAGAVADNNSRQVAYPVDPPHEFVEFLKGESFSGVVALVALGNGRLLVLERSAARGLPPLENRIFYVDTVGAPDATGVERDLAARPELFVKKRLLWKDALGCNLEGLALGPALPGGARSLVAIADNGGIGTPTQLVTFRLTGAGL